MRLMGYAASLDVHEMLTSFNFMERRKISIYLLEFTEERKRRNQRKVEL